MQELYDEAVFLIPKWEDLIENYRAYNNSLNLIKELFKETYFYFKDFQTQCYDDRRVGAMEMEAFHAHLHLVSLITMFLENEDFKYSEDQATDRFYSIIKSFLEYYVLSNTFHSTYADNKVAVKDNIMPDEYWYYDVKTDELIGFEQ